jgi:catalase
VVIGTANHATLTTSISEGARMTTTRPEPTTTDSGIPVESDEHSLTVGADGPILLQDHYLIEQMAQWNRERIPERQPHAKGSGADVMDDAARDRLVGNVAGHLLDGVTEPVLQRAFEYWRNVDNDLGRRVEKEVRAGQFRVATPA